MPLFVKRNTFIKNRGRGRLQIRRDSYSNAAQSWYDTIKQVKARDGGRCCDCGCTEAEAKARYDGKGLQVHHIKALSRGGRTVLSNLATLCYGCHRKRHRHMP